MSRRGKDKNRVTLIGLLREKQDGFGLQPFFGPMGVTMVQKRGDRGVLSCQVFNLRPHNDQTDRGDGYGVWLAGRSGNQDNFILVGHLQPGISGQGGGQWEFNPADVQGSGRSLEEFDRVVIAVTGSENPQAPGDVIPLEGKLEQPENYFSRQMPGVPGIGGIPGIPGMAGIPGISTKGITEVPGITGITGITEIPWPVGISGLPTESTSPGATAMPGTDVEAPGDTCEASLRQLIGLTLDRDGQIKYLVHAIPGRFSPGDQPRQGKTGYVYWQPAARQEEHPGLGYWLVYFDPKTSRVVFPEPIPQGPNI